MQGVIKSYDPATGFGVIVCDELTQTDSGSEFKEYALAENALEDSVFRMLRQGQRVLFELNGDGHAEKLKLGSEVDMNIPEYMLDK